VSETEVETVGEFFVSEMVADIVEVAVADGVGGGVTVKESEALAVLLPLLVPDGDSDRERVADPPDLVDVMDTLREAVPVSEEVLETEADKVTVAETESDFVGEAVTDPESEELSVDEPVIDGEAV
jgi:hypothetical protein